MRNYFYVLICLSFFSCGKTNTHQTGVTESYTKQLTNCSSDSDSIRFSEFCKGFKDIDVDSLNMINIYFNDKYLGKQDSLTTIQTRYITQFLRNVDSYAYYYGFKLKLHNNVTLLIIYTDNYHKKLVQVDTTFFQCCFYNNHGKLLKHLKTQGSNQYAEPATYNSYTRFNFDKALKKLYLDKYEFSTGSDYASVKVFDYDKLIEAADMKISKYVFDFNTLQLIFIGNTKGKAKVIEDSHLSVIEPINMTEFGY